MRFASTFKEGDIAIERNGNLTFCPGRISVSLAFIRYLKAFPTRQIDHACRFVTRQLAIVRSCLPVSEIHADTTAHGQLHSEIRPLTILVPFQLQDPTALPGLAVKHLLKRRNRSILVRKRLLMHVVRSRVTCL